MDERAHAVRRERHLGAVVPQREAFEQLVAEPRHRLERDHRARRLVVRPTRKRRSAPTPSASLAPGCVSSASDAFDHVVHELVVVSRSQTRSGGAADRASTSMTCPTLPLLGLYHLVHEPDGTGKRSTCQAPRRGDDAPARARPARHQPAPAGRGDRHQPPHAHLPLRVLRRPARGHRGAGRGRGAGALPLPGRRSVPSTGRRCCGRCGVTSADPELASQERLFFELYGQALHGRAGHRRVPRRVVVDVVGRVGSPRPPPGRHGRRGQGADAPRPRP